MKFLLTNDDGIDAPGLSALEQAFERLGERVVIAPHRHRSGCSHQATTERTLQLALSTDGRHVLDGTPVDCTRVGLLHLVPDIDWVVSGINEGGNLGADVYMSGTVAAVREAALLGKPGIAVSQYRRRARQVDWQRSARWTQQVVQELLSRPCPPGTFWNVNLPDPDAETARPPIVFCQIDPHPLPVQFLPEEGGLRYVSDYHGRTRLTGHDVDLCFSGHITVTEMSLAWPERFPA